MDEGTAEGKGVSNVKQAEHYPSLFFMSYVCPAEHNFSKWVMPYRTSDPLLVREVGVFLLRSVLLGDCAYLSGFRHLGSEADPVVFGSVLLRLQHGCSTL